MDTPKTSEDRAGQFGCILGGSSGALCGGQFGLDGALLAGIMGSTVGGGTGAIVGTTFAILCQTGSVQARKTKRDDSESTDSPAG